MEISTIFIRTYNRIFCLKERFKCLRLSGVFTFIPNKNGKWNTKFETVFLFCLKKQFKSLPFCNVRYPSLNLFHPNEKLKLIFIAVQLSAMNSISSRTLDRMNKNIHRCTIIDIGVLWNWDRVYGRNFFLFFVTDIWSLFLFVRYDDIYWQEFMR